RKSAFASYLISGGVTCASAEAGLKTSNRRNSERLIIILLIALASHEWPGTYFLTYRFSARGPTSAPYMFPAESAATPSAALVATLSGLGSGSGISAVTVPSLTLPTLMPLFHPGFLAVFDSESAA